MTEGGTTLLFGYLFYIAAKNITGLDCYLHTGSKQKSDLRNSPTQDYKSLVQEF